MAIIGDLGGDGALQDREVVGDAPNLGAAAGVDPTGHCSH
jgi:hypothetical protein